MAAVLSIANAETDSQNAPATTKAVTTGSVLHGEAGTETKRECEREAAAEATYWQHPGLGGSIWRERAMKMKGRQTQPPAGRSAARLTKGTKRKEINSYAEREAELEADVEAIFSKWKRKNPYLGFYGQLGVVFR